MAAKKKGVDASKFEGNGTSFKAKLIGKEDVAEARGDLLCQEAITKLKNAAKTSGQHKQKIYVNVTLEGLKIIDAVALISAQNKKKSADTRNSKTSVDSEESVKTDEMIVLHTHPVHRISFISRDTTDNRAFGYIVGSGDGEHTFFAIKTAAAAEQLVLTLRDLFQVVYEMKKKEVDEAKEKLEGGETPKEGEEAAENSKPLGNGSTSEEGQVQTQETTPAAEADGIYHVPPNNAPVNGSLAEQQANLLDLEDQADSILKGIEQIKNLEFDSMTNDGDKSPASPPMSPPAVFKSGTADPWAVPAAAAPTSTPAATSSLGDLAGIQTGPFVNMQQPFPGASFPAQQMPGQHMPGYNVGAPGFNMGNPGLPVNRDPFGNDPFSAAKFQQQQGVRPGFGTAPAFGNPFGGNAGFGQQPFQPGMARPPMPGMFPGGPAANMNQNPFAANSAAPQEDPNLLKPIRNDQQGESAATQQSNDGSKSPKEDLFGDLLGIKKSTSAALTPKDMFAQLSSADKKSMNDMKMPPKASFDDFVWDPFLNEGGNVSEDKRRGLIPSEGEDPFNTSHIPFLPPSSTVPPPQVPPPLPQRVLPSSSQNQQPMNKNKFDDKLQPPPSSSTSSLSSPSSSSSSLSPSSSSSSSKPPSSLIPPPPPSRVKNNPSPSSLPTPLLLISNDDNNNNTSGKPSDVSTPFVLPSPDEPPPPLPQDFIKSPAAPPPPPRPSSSKSLSSLSSSSNTPRSEQSSPSSILSTPNPSQPSSQSQHTLSSSSSLSLSPSSSFSDPQSKPSSNKPSKRSKNMLKYDLSFTVDASTDPFSVPLKSSSSSHNEDSSRKKNSINSDSSKDSFDQSFDFISHRTPEKRGASFGHKDSSESSPVILNKLQHNTNNNNNNNASPNKTEHDVDPFGLPLHLTPGFKAVARFGNDPFEDSFGAGSNANVSEQDLLAKWDPFPDTPSPFDKPSTASSNLNSSDPWNNAFGDAFAPQN